MKIIKKEWRGAISYSRKLTDEAVICLFSDSWSASPTWNHTHFVEFLHFRRGKLTREKLSIAEKIFSLLKQLSKYFPYDENYQQIENEIVNLEIEL